MSATVTPKKVSHSARSSLFIESIFHRREKSMQSSTSTGLHISIIGTWLLSLVITVLALVLADFGGPSWIFILCGLWLCTVGLPTTLTLLTLAAFWGPLPGLETPPLSVFALSVAILSFLAQ